MKKYIYKKTTRVNLKKTDQTCDPSYEKIISHKQQINKKTKASS
jgi:hypothetical protein